MCQSLAFRFPPNLHTFFIVMHNPELLERPSALPASHRDPEPTFQAAPDLSASYPRYLEPGDLPLDPQSQKRRGPVSRLASLLAPLNSALYDAQMLLKGVRLIRHRVQLANYPHNAPPLKIGFISDLHYGPTSGRSAARQAWTLLRDAQPDLLLLGGDFLYADERGLPTLMRELQRWKHIAPPAGMYAVMGGHDHLTGTQTLATCLEACDVRVLRNDAAELPYPWHDVWVAGCDAVKNGDPQAELAVSGVPRGAATIMLSHSPEVCQYDVLKQCGLTLCGGTHGGQVAKPGGEPIWMPTEWGKQYPAGLFRHAGNWVFVSRGVGTVGVPVRLFAPPDVALFEIVGRGAVRR